MIIIRFEDIPGILNREDVDELIDLSVSKGTSLNTLCANLTTEELSFFVEEFLRQNSKEEFLDFCKNKSLPTYIIIYSAFNWVESLKGLRYWTDLTLNKF